MRPRDLEHPVLGTGQGHLREGLLLDATFQPQYCAIYDTLIDGPPAPAGSERTTRA